jgi:DNA-binding GntR family transcriptional regulator
MSRSQNLAQKAHQRIIAMMVDGVLVPGDALPEATLGAALGMSRTPVREAIKRIVSEGLAVSDGRMIRVRRLLLPEIEEVFFLRLALEPKLARGAVRLAPARIDQMEQRIRRLMASGPEHRDSHWQTDNDLHDLLADAAGNQTARMVLQGLRQRTCVFDHKLLPERFAQGCAEHLRILDAVRGGDPETVQREMTRHLEQARDAVLARLRRVPDRGEP